MDKSCLARSRSHHYSPVRLAKTPYGEGWQVQAARTLPGALCEGFEEEERQLAAIRAHAWRAPFLRGCSPDVRLLDWGLQALSLRTHAPIALLAHCPPSRRSGRLCVK